MYFFIQKTKHLGINSITNLWSIVDILIICTNFLICTGLFNNEFYKPDDEKAHIIEIQEMRVIESIGILFMWFKSMYFLQLNPKIAPLIDILFVIVRDMKFFLIIFMFVEVAFMQTYYILGRNQMEIEDNSSPSHWN